MKIKKLIILGVTVLSTTLLAACSNSSIKYTKDGVGTVTIKKYKGVEADMADAAIADDEMKTILENAYETAPSYKTLSKDVENGDTVNIDFEGSINGEKFEGGTAQATDLTIGSGGFIEGFEEQLIGMKAGEEKTITVTFPADYYSQDLAGKEAQFKVKVNEIKEKLNSDEGINDEWVKTFVTAQGLDKGIDSVDKLKEFIISNRKNQYEADAVNTNAFTVHPGPAGAPTQLVVESKENWLVSITDVEGDSQEVNALKAIGYKEIVAYLNGEMDLKTANELIKRNTRRFAKRQLTWFKRYDDFHWFDMSETTDEEIVSWVAKNM